PLSLHAAPPIWRVLRRNFLDHGLRDPRCPALIVPSCGTRGGCPVDDPCRRRSFLVIVLAATIAGVTVAALPRRLAPPVVVDELLHGIVVGPEILGLAQVDQFI